MRKLRNPEGIMGEVEEVLNEWAALFKPMESLGFVVHSYDPGVVFKSKENAGHLATFSLSVSDLKIINAAITR